MEKVYMSSVAVMLATFNGAKYLKEQIESILSQSFEDWTLYIRDDGSKDSTHDVIEQYTEKYPDKIIEIKDESLVGVVQKQILLQYKNGSHIMLHTSIICFPTKMIIGKQIKFKLLS